MQANIWCFPVIIWANCLILDDPGTGIQARKGHESQRRTDIVELEEQLKERMKNHRLRICGPQHQHPAKVSRLDWQLLKAKVELQAMGAIGDLKLLPDVLPALGSQTSPENDVWNDENYYYWTFDSPGQLTSETMTRFAAIAFVMLAQIVPDAHVSAHCVCIRWEDSDSGKQEKRFAIIDTDARGELQLPQLLVTPPKPASERRERIENWLKNKKDYEDRIQTLTERLNSKGKADDEEEIEMQEKLLNEIRQLETEAAKLGQLGPRTDE